MPDQNAARGDPSAAAGPLSLLLECPKCGAPLAVTDEMVTTTCEHCASLLLLETPSREEAYVADPLLTDAADLLDMVIAYRVLAHRAELMEGLRDADGQVLPEFWIEGRLAAFERELRATTRIVEAYVVHAPYWHVTGTIVQGLLCRHADGPKHVRVRAWGVEHTVPAYGAGVSLRDRGLRLSRARVRPLTVREVRERGAFLPWQPFAPATFREIERWKLTDLDPTVQPVTRYGALVASRRVLVYRPYWLARIASGMKLAWVLADGSFRTIAGYPSPAEVRTILERVTTDPLRSGEASYRTVAIIASRCPDCGHEQRLDPRHRIVICASCHLALRPAPKGIAVVRYSHARRGPSVRLDGDYLPFWRFDLSVAASGETAPVGRLEEYAQRIAPRAAMNESPPSPRGAHLWVPAFRLLGTAAGDRAFKDIAEWVHAAELEVLEGKIPLGGNARPAGVTVAEDEARELGTLALFAIHERASAARLTTRAVQKWLVQAKLSLTNARLVLVPFDDRKDALAIEDARVAFSSLLVRGGAELEALRETVHRVRR